MKTKMVQQIVIVLSITNRQLKKLQRFGCKPGTTKASSTLLVWQSASIGHTVPDFLSSPRVVLMA